MISTLYSFGRVVGAEITLIGYLICTLLYFILCILDKTNRTITSFRRVVFGWLVAEVICDGIWFTYYFPDGHYVNHGMAGTYVALLWPLLLLLAGLTVTTINSKQKSSDE